MGMWSVQLKLFAIARGVLSIELGIAKGQGSSKNEES